jgi:hypothetical protein
MRPHTNIPRSNNQELAKMARRKWSKKFEKCEQCGTDRYKHLARGLCTRCYPLVRKLEQVNGWSVDNPGDLEENLTDKILGNPERFERAKSNVANQIRDRLERLKIREEKLEGSVDGMDIECQLQWLIRQCPSVRDKELCYGTASTFNDEFNMEQRKILYELLNDIEENVRWTGIDWFRVWRESR